MYSAGIGGIERLTLQLKEKFTLESFGPVIAQCQASEDWKCRQAGYLVPGLIAEACKDQMKANLDEALATATKALSDPHQRVQYAGL